MRRSHTEWILGEGTLDLFPGADLHCQQRGVRGRGRGSERQGQKAKAKAKAAANAAARAVAAFLAEASVSARSRETSLLSLWDSAGAEAACSCQGGAFGIFVHGLE